MNCVVFIFFTAWAVSQAWVITDYSESYRDFTEQTTSYDAELTTAAYMNTAHGSFYETSAETSTTSDEYAYTQQNSGDTESTTFVNDYTDWENVASTQGTTNDGDFTSQTPVEEEYNNGEESETWGKPTNDEYYYNYAESSTGPLRIQLCIEYGDCFGTNEYCCWGNTCCSMETYYMQMFIQIFTKKVPHSKNDPIDFFETI